MGETEYVFNYRNAAASNKKPLRQKAEGEQKKIIL